MSTVCLNRHLSTIIMGAKICSGVNVALELNKLTGQVEKMGQTIARRQSDYLERIVLAREVLSTQPAVTDELKAKIQQARQIDEWRRGAAPLGQRLDERRIPTPPVAQASLIAADGSQIYPDRHGIASYYLLNTGSIVFRKGSGQAPIVNSAPQIHFEDEDLYDDDDQMRPQSTSTRSGTGWRSRRSPAWPRPSGRSTGAISVSPSWSW